MKVTKEISKERMKKYEKKFEIFDKLSEDMRLVAMKKDPTMFAYGLFRNNDGSRMKLYAFQDMILNDKSKMIAIAISRQVGKSVGAIILALWKIYWNDNYTVLLISKTLAQSKELISKLRAIINSSPMRDDFKETATGPDNRSEFYLKNHGKETQSRIISVPATDAARGYSADLVIADEIAFWENSIEVFNEAILPTVSHTDGTIMMLSTPKGNIGVFYEAFTKPNIWSCYQFTWAVCPVHTPEKMEIKRQQIGDFAFRQEYEASFVANQAAYFSHDEVKRAINPNITLGKHISNPVVIGVDFGKKNDNTVITIGMIPNPDDHPDYHYIEIVDIIEKPLNTDYNVIIGELKALFMRYNVMNVIYDATGVGEGPGDFMKDLGVRVEPFKFSIQSKVNIYSNLKILFEKSQIKIPDNKRLIDELLLFEYKYTEAGNMKLHHPEGGHDDYADSLALMCYGLKRPGHKPVSVSLISKSQSLNTQKSEDEVDPKFKDLWKIMGLEEV